MEITDVRVRSLSDTADRLKAVCTVTFDGSFVVRDVKVVDGANGLFVAMPSRKVTISCNSCRHKNVVRAKYCNECGSRLPENQVPPGDLDGRGKLHRDIAHPITSEFRAIVQGKIIEAYQAAVEAYEEPEVEEFEEAVDDDVAVGSEPQTQSTPVTGGAPDEYNDMIAGLKGGKGSGGGGARRSERGGQGGRTDRPRGRRGRGRDQAAKDRRPEEKPDRRPEEKVEKKKAEEKVATASASDSDEPFSAGLDLEPPRQEHAPADRVSIKEAAVEPVSADDSNEDSAPFGMGLL
ncbi:MAG: SpoVG family protein [Phycisphaerae bacterium]